MRFKGHAIFHNMKGPKDKYLQHEGFEGRAMPYNVWGSNATWHSRTIPYNMRNSKTMHNLPPCTAQRSISILRPMKSKVRPYPQANSTTQTDEISHHSCVSTTSTRSIKKGTTFSHQDQQIWIPDANKKR